MVKIQKEDILNIAFEIVRKKGIEGLNVRAIANELNSSVQPIYYQFKNFEELQKELYEKIEKYFYSFLLEHTIKEIPVYKQIGINYIEFAKQESNLYKILFMTENKLPPKEFISKNNKDFKEIAKYVYISTELKDDDLKEFHIKMWIFAHGIATLVANNTCKFTDEQISKLLSDEFQTLMLLEENPNNKWVLDKEKYHKEGEK